MPDEFQASVLDDGEGFFHVDVLAAVWGLVDSHGAVGVEFTSRKIDVFSAVPVSVDVAGEKAAFC